MRINLLANAFTVASLLIAGLVVKAEDTPTAASATLDQYVAIQQALAEDSLEHVAHNAEAIAKAAAENKVHGLPAETAAQAEAVAKAKDIKATRDAFKKLSKSFETYLKDHPDKSGKYHTAYCPMAKAGWVQTGDTIANPYYGKSMLRCGTFKP